MTIDELKKNYGCVDCQATKDAVDKYNKVDERFSIAIENAMKELEAERVRKHHIENDKIGLK